MTCSTRPNYLISYATYVSATILVRLAAQKEHGSDAHKALRRCVDVIDIQQATCWSLRRAKRVLDGLILRMGVVLDNQKNGDISDSLTSDLDIDAIIRTFAQEQAEGRHIQDSSSESVFNEQLVPANNYLMFLEDPIFGFSGTAHDDLDFGYGAYSFDGSQ
jgi:hypothetical protein